MLPVPKYWLDKRTWWALLALAGFVFGAALALHHPLWPVGALVFFYLACVLFACCPGIWLLLVPACLPWLNFSPWTGWLMFEEFDLLMLGVFAGAYARLSWQARCEQAAFCPHLKPHERVFAGLVLALAVSGVTALLRGLEDAGGSAFGWFDGYTDPLNSLRAIKRLLFAILTLPLLRDEMKASRARASLRLAVGMGLGLACVTVVAFWERLAYPGLMDFSIVYRTTALFWEMHVGGGAIDAYLALATPFAFCGLLSTRRAWPKFVSLLLVALTAYACLMTFSRGVYLVAVLQFILLVVLSRFYRLSMTQAGTEPAVPARFWRLTGRGMRLLRWLALVMAVIASLVLGPDTFMGNRVTNTDRVIKQRLVHWHEAVALLRTRSDWALGLGLGRFPATYDLRAAGGEFPGGIRRHDGGPHGASYVELKGGPTKKQAGGLFALTQRVGIQPGVRYRVSMDVHVPAPILLSVRVCERHLLYDWNCQESLLRIDPVRGEWQHQSFQLSGPLFAASSWYAPRLGVLVITVVNAAGLVDLRNISLMAPGRREQLQNGDFARGLAHWFPAAQYYFLPWHTDSLYLEVLIERGLAGLVIFIGLMVFTFICLLFSPGRNLLSTYLAVSLFGALLVGLVSSLMDVPRVAFLFYFLSFFSIQLTGGLSRYRIVQDN